MKNIVIIWEQEVRRELHDAFSSAVSRLNLNNFFNVPTPISSVCCNGLNIDFKDLMELIGEDEPGLFVIHLNNDEGNAKQFYLDCCSEYPCILFSSGGVDHSDWLNEETAILPNSQRIRQRVAIAKEIPFENIYYWLKHWKENDLNPQLLHGTGIIIEIGSDWRNSSLQREELRKAIFKVLEGYCSLYILLQGYLKLHEQGKADLSDMEQIRDFFEPFTNSILTNFPYNDATDDLIRSLLQIVNLETPDLSMLMQEYGSSLENICKLLVKLQNSDLDSIDMQIFQSEGGKDLLDLFESACIEYSRASFRISRYFCLMTQ